jgi:hypothetical protein
VKLEKDVELLRGAFKAAIGRACQGSIVLSTRVVHSPNENVTPLHELEFESPSCDNTSLITSNRSFTPPRRHFYLDGIDFPPPVSPKFDVPTCALERQVHTKATHTFDSQHGYGSPKTATVERTTVAAPGETANSQFSDQVEKRLFAHRSRGQGGQVVRVMYS